MATPTPTPTPTPTQEASPPPPPAPASAPSSPNPEATTDPASALDESDGSSKSATSEQIESYADGGAENGDPVASADAIPPPKRGRGRPPKPKLIVSSSDGASSGEMRRPRGRPPKPRDPSAPAKVPRPRGRPPKNGAAAGAGVAPGGAAKRPRGRPPKMRPQCTEQNMCLCGTSS